VAAVAQKSGLTVPQGANARSSCTLASRSIPDTVLFNRPELAKSDVHAMLAQVAEWIDVGSVGRAAADLHVQVRATDVSGGS
jgi:hypothetical protein